MYNEIKCFKCFRTILIQGNILNNGINEFSDNTNSLTVKNAEATVLDNLNIKSEKVHMKETCNANLSNKNVKCDMRWAYFFLNIDNYGYEINSYLYFLGFSQKVTIELKLVYV